MNYRLIHRIQQDDYQNCRVLVFTVETRTGSADFAHVPLSFWQTPNDIEQLILIKARDLNAVLKGMEDQWPSAEKLG